MVRFLHLLFARPILTLRLGIALAAWVPASAWGLAPGPLFPTGRPAVAPASPAGAPPTSVEDAPPGELLCLPSAAGQPRVRAWPEMTPLGSDGFRPIPSERLVATAASSARAGVTTFRSRWAAACQAVENRLPSGLTFSLSRWAGSQTRTFIPEIGWLGRLPMRRLGRLPESGTWVFGQEVEEGLPLPSHSPIVFRRLLVRVLYEPRLERIIEVQVTIRGWREE